MILITPLGKTRIMLKGISMFICKWSCFKVGYVSEIDQFLHELDRLPGIKSDVRLEEEQKYNRIFALRDLTQINIPEQLPWKDF